MKEKIVSLDVATLARSIGFNEPCFHIYHPECGLVTNGRYHKNSKIHVPSEDENDYVTAPSQTVMQKWLRINHNYDVLIDRCKSGYNFFIRANFGTDKSDTQYQSGHCVEYEDALDLGLGIALRRIDPNCKTEAITENFKKEL